MKAGVLVVAVLLFVDIAMGAGLSPKAYRQLNDLQQGVSQSATPKEREALKLQLLSLKKDLAFNSTGLALTLQTLAQLEFLQGRQQGALAYLNEAMAIENLEKPIYLQVATYLAQMLFNIGEYQKTIKLLSDIIDLKKPEDLAFDYALLAASYYSLDNLAKGLPFIERAIALKESPKEAWLQMAFSGYVQLKNYPRALNYINRLVYRYPNKKEYWLQKSSVHQLAGEYPLASNVKELAYMQGYIQSDMDFINLAQLLASQGDPYKVARLLQKEIDDGNITRDIKVQRLLYSALLAAKEIEMAIVAMKLAYEKYNDTQDGLLLAQYLVDKEDWYEARIILLELIGSEAIAQSNSGEVLFLLGVCQFRLGDEDGALISLGKASVVPKTSSKAKSWMGYIKQFQS